MLIRYKKHYEKIAMGLLSFMPKEKNLNNLRATMKKYEADPNYKLYLWKHEEDMIGIIGIYVQGDSIQIEHVCVNPSHRQQGIGKQIVKALSAEYPTKNITASEDTMNFYDKCFCTIENSVEQR
ncbi:GNAT family N-acetyltransferase [Priestia taiwanensis]|uniref:Protein RibT n=1 Tax=Priestia taiwanensis TaxID=1347902 RepID=A0A917AIE8_9BACI|nr:GNAT family N-acetyltransferase [Priestia taiwanensis]MBM7361493.1 riboflavin biosynthesis RibT protein [Priestia taiwanensis]GGE54619.1 protein RibT [Priestia taiwanensis]